MTMLMWGDRFLDGAKTGYGRWEASMNGTWPAIVSPCTVTRWRPPELRPSTSS